MCSVQPFALIPCMAAYLYLPSAALLSPMDTSLMWNCRKISLIVASTITLEVTFGVMISSQSSRMLSIELFIGSLEAREYSVLYLRATSVGVMAVADAAPAFARPVPLSLD